MLSVANQNGTWAPAPISIDLVSGADWITYGFIQGTSCVVCQTPGNGCANALINSAGDTWVYALNLSAATLGTNNGNLNFIFGGDSRVSLVVGLGGLAEVWGGSAPIGNGFDSLGCSGTPVTSAGNTQAQYNNCNGIVSFSPSSLNPDLSLTITATVVKDPIVGCPTCGNPTGFVLEGTLQTGTRIAATPEPGTFGLMAFAGIGGIALLKKRST